MCGIAGVLAFAGQPVRAGDVRRMSQLMRHRGQDGAAMALGGRPPVSFDAQICSDYPGIALAHRRLSVIDLSAQANQPMSYAEGRLWISYNGELYNYQDLRARLIDKGYGFATQSDTEVLLAAYHCWGAACVEQFNGMFAFAIWDNQTRSLFCARDPVGIKPLYYSTNPNSFAFASESRALAALAGGDIDPDALGAYFLSMYVPGTWSVFRGVRKLAAGTTLSVDSTGAITERRYWSLPTDGAHARVSEDELEALLDAAVSRQLQSDVPVGAFLSGGVDSSTVVAMAAGHTPDLRTYSVAYEGLGLDETPYARGVAQAYATRHTELSVRADHVLDTLDSALAACTEPIADTSLVANFVLARRAADDGVKVLLNGTGGDEVFAGYRRYLPGRFPRRLVERLPQSILRACSYVGHPFSPVVAARLGSLGLDMMHRTSGGSRVPARMFGNRSDLGAFLARVGAASEASIAPYRRGARANMRFDFSVYLPDQLLLMLDQTTMASTVEGRVPLLDTDLVASAYRAPLAMHLAGGQTKAALKSIARRYVGSEVVDRRKQGFGGPEVHWVRQNPEKVRAKIDGYRSIPALAGTDLSDYLDRRLDRLDTESLRDLFRLYCFVSWYDGVAAGASQQRMHGEPAAADPGHSRAAALRRKGR